MARGKQSLRARANFSPYVPWEAPALTLQSYKSPVVQQAWCPPSLSPLQLTDHCGFPEGAVCMVTS